MLICMVYYGICTPRCSTAALHDQTNICVAKGMIVCPKGDKDNSIYG